MESICVCGSMSTERCAYLTINLWLTKEDQENIVLCFCRHQTSDLERFWTTLYSDATQFLIFSIYLIRVNYVFGGCDPPSFFTIRKEEYQFNNRKPNLGKVTANTLSMCAFES